MCRKGDAVTRKVVQFELADIALDDRGFLTSGDDLFVVGFSLAYPCVGVPVLHTSVQFTKASLADDIAAVKAAFERRILFKTELQGNTLLKVDVFALHKPSRFSQVLGHLLYGVLDATVGVLLGTITAKYVGALSGTVANQALDGLKGDDNAQAVLIGSARLALDADSTLSPTLEGVIKADNAVSITWLNMAGTPETGNQPVPETTVLFQPGESCGRFALNCKVLS